MGIQYLFEMRIAKLRGHYLFTSYQFAKLKYQIDIVPGY
jgi:hypothetical protein